VSRRHPSDDELDRFLRAELDSKASKRAVRHLLRGCNSCAMSCHRQPNLKLVANYDKEFNRAELASILIESGIETERRTGAQLWELLEPRAPQTRLLVVRNNRRFQNWGLYQHVMGKVRPTSRKDPFAAVDLAHLAVTIACHINEDDYGCERVHDFKGAAYSMLGFAMRNAGDFAGANSAFELAGDELKCGTGDPIEDAMLAVNIASVLFALGELDAAIKLLNSAIRLFRRAGDFHSMGLTFIQQAHVFSQTSRPELGLFLAEKGLSLMDLDKQPHAELSGRDAMAWCYNAIGDHEEAFRIVYTYDHLYRRFEDEPAIWGKREWILGRIEAGKQDFDEALGHLANAYEIFLKAFLYFDAVLVALDRIEMLIYMRRSKEAVRIAERLYPLLRRWGLKGDSLRLWEMMTLSIETGDFLIKKYSQTLAEHLRKTWIPRPTGADFRRSPQRS